VAASIRSIEKSSDLIQNVTHDLPTCSIMPQPATLLCAPIEEHTIKFLDIIEWIFDVHMSIPLYNEPLYDKTDKDLFQFLIK
jgi:hypothetical protein